MLAHTAISKCLRVGCFSLEKCQWKISSGKPRNLVDCAFYFHHLASWWPHRSDPNVVLVFYEDLQECYESSVRSIAEFMGITDEGCIQVALERGMSEFMKQHTDKFSLKLKLFKIAAMSSVAYQRLLG